jgi:hypothetical protein
MINDNILSSVVLRSVLMTFTLYWDKRPCRWLLTLGTSLPNIMVSHSNGQEYLLRNFVTRRRAKFVVIFHTFGKEKRNFMAGE